LDWYIRNEYKQKVCGSDIIKNWNEKIVQIDESGLFTRLLLVEIDSLSKKVSFRKVTDEITNEIIELINFVYNISSKEIGENVPLDISTHHIKMGIILVGKSNTIKIQGVDPYLKRFRYKLIDRFDTIYVIQYERGVLGFTNSQKTDEFKELTQKLKQKIEANFEIRKDFELKYTYLDPERKYNSALITRYSPIYS
jgi:hypothetical protein